MEKILKELDSYLGYRDYSDDEGLTQEVIDNAKILLKHIFPLIPESVEFNEDYIYPTSDTIIFDIQNNKGILISIEIGKNSVHFFISGLEKYVFGAYYMNELEKINSVFNYFH